MTIAYISHPDCQLHEMGEGHPESPARLRAIEQCLFASDISKILSRYTAPAADRKTLQLAHSVEHVARIFETSPDEGLVQLDPDTAMNPHSLSAALHAAGGGVLALDLIMAEKHQSAFCAVRPPGHHAESDKVMGFCFFNNVAVAAAYAMANYGLERIAILDFDVHHGNGTEDIFRADQRVLFCSTFQHPFYPCSGAQTRSTHIVNCPLPSGSGGEAFRLAVTDRWLPALIRHAPQLIFISAGFDAHSEDYLAELNFSDADYGWVTREIKAVANTYCEGRIVSLLEGGYTLNALARCVLAHLTELAG